MPTRRTNSRALVQGPPVRREAQEILTCLKPLVESIAKTFGSQLEVVLHDLRTPEKSIVAIANGHITGRQVGGPVIGGPVNDKALRLLQEERIGVRALISYPTRTRDGRELKSSSIVYYSRFTNKPIVALCLNYDLTAIQTARSVLEAFLHNDAVQPSNDNDRGARGGAVDLEKTIQAMIVHAISANGKPVAMMDKNEKSAIVSALDEAGLFIIRGAVERVATALGVSRFTIYNYLKERRRRSTSSRMLG